MIAAVAMLEMDCRVCGSREVELVLDLGDQPHCNSLLRPEDLDHPEPIYPLRLGFCRVCSTSQIDHTVPKETMFSEYLYVSGTTASLRRHFAQSARRLAASLGLEEGDLVVDIGSNDGTWLEQFKAQGQRVLGVEPAANLAVLARGRGIDTIPKFFTHEVAEEILFEHGAPRLVTAAGVFFHLEELHSATAGVAALCDAGARFCVQAIYLAGMLGQNAFDQIYHEHLTYWNLISFEKLLERYDLEVNCVSVVPIHGGSLEMVVSSRGRHAVDPGVARFRGEELARDLHEIEPYRAFAARVWEMRDSLLGILERYAAEERTVYAFGAPAKGATLLNSFGITPRLVSLAVERNPLKVGKLIPGARIPILDEEAVQDPDAYLMLPWNFLDEFIERRADYLRAGGGFIVPIPAPRVVDSASVEGRGPSR